MEQNSKNRVQLFCEHKNPGPCYKLKTLLGHDGHCASKLRQPAFSIKGKQKDVYNDTPGPGYCYDSYLTNHGRQLPKTAFVTSRPKAKEPVALPGPGLYEPKALNNSQSYSFGIKSESLPNLCPAPNAYNTMRGIGSKSSLDRSPHAATIRSRADFGNIYYLSKKAGTPGPGSYGKLDNDRSKSVTIKGRFKAKNYDTSLQNPAPGSYNLPSFVDIKKGFSIGVKHSPYLMPVKFDATA